MSDLEASIIAQLSGGQRRNIVELIAEIGTVRENLESELEDLIAQGLVVIEERDGDQLYRLGPDAVDRALAAAAS
jgi:DNA-binding IclR family transcriptional regulator